MFSLIKTIRLFGFLLFIFTVSGCAATGAFGLAQEIQGKGLIGNMIRAIKPSNTDNSSNTDEPSSVKRPDKTACPDGQYWNILEDKCISHMTEKTETDCPGNMRYSFVSNKCIVVAGDNASVAAGDDGGRVGK